ncbi:DASH complex subunit DAD2 [Neolecta irregularis DAH-3]|uniref:DASH complex subunit DAD2 n=1 Tax=Neolecta irregularis (strain DAH-3) TaxID=1198029 RepID=A0A1U7LIH3_NEOID|nr:DASH complex subunit DAD2 [Neolecta irregularis DAH-3]|eukprot:OLL22428.1 DASH complex subunit DAD2 [Neolecta irregularis DAH-3]
MQRRYEPSSSPAVQALQAKILGKQREYENLLHLKDLSVGLASQMEQLNLKIDTLSLGTDAIADVLSGWSNVFRAINLSTCKINSVQGTA